MSVHACLQGAAAPTRMKMAQIIVHGYAGPCSLTVCCCIDKDDETDYSTCVYVPIKAAARRGRRPQRKPQEGSPSGRCDGELPVHKDDDGTDCIGREYVPSKAAVSSVTVVDGVLHHRQGRRWHWYVRTSVHTRFQGAAAPTRIKMAKTIVLR